MAFYEPAFNLTMSHEDAALSGKISDEPNGGKARLGINSIANPDAVAAGFYTMPVDEALSWAANFYKYRYWVPIQGYSIQNQDVANKIFDLAVNLGIEQAIKLTQRAVGTQIDGILGQTTLAAINAQECLSALKDKAKDFYIGLVAARPSDQKYLQGWLARAAS